MPKSSRAGKSTRRSYQADTADSDDKEQRAVGRAQTNGSKLTRMWPFANTKEVASSQDTEQDSSSEPSIIKKTTEKKRRSAKPAVFPGHLTDELARQTIVDDSSGKSSEKYRSRTKTAVASRSVAVSMPVMKTEETQMLPDGYGEDRIVIQVRDPHWIHAYWEVTAARYDAMYLLHGATLQAARNVLRIYDITNIEFNGVNANSFFDIDVQREATNWYINVGTPGKSVCVDIGLLLPDGRFITLARSNYISLPLAGPSWITDEEWMVVESDFNRLYGLSVGFGIGMNSADIKRLMAKKLKHQLSSGAFASGALFSPGASASLQRGGAGAEAEQLARQRNFWLVVNTELIVYGATEPDAQVTVQGRPIRLNKDGTFSLRFALPDGEQVIPVRAVSADAVDERVITPIVLKRTE